jgi:hypothetical protein
MVMSALTASGKNPNENAEKKTKKKKEDKKQPDLTLETGPGNVGPSAFVGPLAELPPEAGMQYVGPGGGQKPFDVTLNQLLNMPPGTDVQGAIGTVPPQIGVQGDTAPAQVASGQAGQAGQAGQFQPMDVEPYPEMGFGKKLLMGAMGAVPFLNLAAYPFYKAHQEKVANMQARDERTGDWFFEMMEEQPQAASKLLTTPFIREALTRRYGIDTPEELQSLQEYSKSVGIPLSQAAAGLATGKLTPYTGQGGAGVGDVGIGPDAGLTGAGLAPPTGGIPSPIGMLQSTPQVLGRGERFVSPTTGQVVTKSQLEEQQTGFLDAYKKANPEKTDLDGWMSYMYAAKGQVPFETTSGGNRVVITDRLTGRKQVIDGISLDKSNITVKEIWDESSDRFLGWLMIDRDDMTHQQIWLEDIVPEDTSPGFLTDPVGWSKENLPAPFAAVVEDMWDKGAKIFGKRKGAESPTTPTAPRQKGKTKKEQRAIEKQEDKFDRLLNKGTE